MRRLLIVGCGDVGMRLLPLAVPRYRVYALTHSSDRMPELRHAGAIPILGDLDDPRSLARIGGLAEDVIHMVPPQGQGSRDTRTTHLIQALASGGSLPQRFVYLSTTGVYGDCGGAWVDESRPTQPQTDRAQRRTHAEAQLRAWAGSAGVRLSILRVPGIYAPNRLPVARLRARTPVLEPAADPYTNHIHADDLARVTLTALTRGRANRTYNASDHSCMRMGEYFEFVAERLGLPAPPRVPLDEARARLPATLLSFMGESRRIRNRRLREELRFVFRYPTVREGIPAGKAA